MSHYFSYKKVIFLLLSVPLLSVALAANKVAWNDWTDSAFAQAKAEKKLVLIDLSAEWCAYCKKMDATTWQDAKVLAAIAKDYVPIKVVDEKDPQLAARYRDYGRPAVIIMDADGTELLHKRGYMKPQWMEWMLQAVVEEQDSDEI